MQLIHSFFVASLFASVATAFAPTLSSKRPFFVHKMNDEWSSSEASGGGSGGIERLEFTIFPDGTFVALRVLVHHNEFPCLHHDRL
jgi:hypothetical protein